VNDQTPMLRSGRWILQYLYKKHFSEQTMLDFKNGGESNAI